MRINVFFFCLFALSIIACRDENAVDMGDDLCACGIIVNDSIDESVNCYWLEVENDCTGNQKKFCVDQLIWYANKPGDRICFKYQSNW
jgi:hypothetical protein